MRDIGVDPYGIRIMSPKAMHYLVKINSLSNITANILKQEMLSLGADVAVSRGALTGQVKQTDCLLMGNLSQFCQLSQKLLKQPFGLNKLARALNLNLKNYRRDNFVLDLGRFKLNLGLRAHIMGIMNITPDSFSGDGLYEPKNRKTKELEDNIFSYARQLVRDGADIIDVGGESTRPGARAVSAKEELSRVIPVIKRLAKSIGKPISIDTCKPQVAEQALDCGAAIVNDITGLKNPGMAKIAAKYKAGVVVMHMKGTPRTMQKNPRYGCLLGEITEFLQNAIARSEQAGVDREKIIIDPGIGFGKSYGHNLEILKNLDTFKVLGRPILVGVSRKSFLGKILRSAPQERVFGTVSGSLAAVANGARIVRVHDVKAVKQALRVFEEIEKI
ncbi:MAG: dihydropteroate synthase [Candidatus Omnitrophica bacterium]|nr:dihydropteroate synthase [Candidatus Omnitrophota bacterium]